MKTHNKIEIIRELIVGDELNQLKDQYAHQSKESQRQIAKLEKRTKKKVKGINKRLDDMSKLIKELNKNLKKLELEKTDRKAMQKLLVRLSQSI